MVSEATEAPQEPQKRRGRPKGSVNKNKASNGNVETSGYLRIVGTDLQGGGVTETIPFIDSWSFTPNQVSVKLASEHAPEGLDAVIKEHNIVGVSALPNGNASIITNIGMQQPFILVTAEPYESVKNKVFPGVK